MSVTIRCPRCDHFFTEEFSELPKGITINCPKCKTMLEVEDANELIAGKR